MAFNLFPQTDFRQMDLNYVLDVSKRAAVNLEEYTADKEQVVATQAAAEQALAAAQEDIQTATQAATSASRDAQTASGAAQTATQAAESAEQDAQTASAAAERAEQVQESIPADYTDLSNQVSELKSDLDYVEENGFYKKLVIDDTDERTYETEPSDTIAIAHPYSFVAGKKYTLEVTVNSASFSEQLNALRADTSRVDGVSVSGLNTALLRINNTTTEPITNGSKYNIDFIALDSDVNLLMRYKFSTGAQNISVKCYEWISTKEKLDEIEEEISDITDIVAVTKTCIDATDERTYEADPTTIAIAHPYDFIPGRKYKAVLTVTKGSFLDSTNTIRVQQSMTTGTGTSDLIHGSFVFAINANQIADGNVYESEFIAAEGCVNLLARYKFSAGESIISLVVTTVETIRDDVESLTNKVNNNYDYIVQNSRMLMGAHRGAEAFAPPNCVAAYEIAGKMGFPWAWLAQIRWSSSGTLYVMHDADVSITTNGTGNIQDLSDEYINSLLCNKITSYDYSQFSDDDLRVPTLEKAIQICLRYGMKMCFRIEPFPNQIETELHQTIWDNFERLVKEYGISADWCCYSGYNAAEMVRCITLFGEDAELCPFIGAVSAQDVVNWFNGITSVTVKHKSVLLNASSLTLADVKLLHTNGIKVYAFTGSTTPTQELMENLANWGVDILQNPRYAKNPIV